MVGVSQLIFAVNANMFTGRSDNPDRAWLLDGMRLLLTSLVSCLVLGPAAAEWRAEPVPTPGRVTSVEVRGTDTRIAVGPNWYRIAPATGTLISAQAPGFPAVPPGGLSDGRVASGDGAIARTWLAHPTDRYRHGVLGDAIEAGSLVIERSDGRTGTVPAGADAVFEDLSPRIAALDGVDRIVVVKSYLQRGSALAIIDAVSMKIIAETPPIGRAHAWLNPAGIADFDGDGTTDIALVRQPHVAGLLQLWSWQDQKLKKVAEVPDVSNHFIGSRALGMSWTADFDADGHPDLAVPSLDRRSLRLIAFVPMVRDIARIPLPARVATNIGPTGIGGRPGLVAGLEDGRLVIIRK
ncbi:MAG: VCBS repeat-containing protein [Bradyrhizobium sp.]|uniref:FG-GAP repeat domain-containing protein n=1 Tax=Bradyrhizobium sp. TaxID=376 RepID=UPI002731168B|nr:VCBS repeat-containing protein [Bradyrhizobium sp.]MDP1865258.1 VCBS repeat-containing protein [Bradyrhizobium sp.]